MSPISQSSVKERVDICIHISCGNWARLAVIVNRNNLSGPRGAKIVLTTADGLGRKAILMSAMSRMLRDKTQPLGKSGWSYGAKLVTA